MGKSLAALGRSRAISDTVRFALGLQESRSRQQAAGQQSQINQQKLQMNQMQMQQMQQEREYYQENVSPGMLPVFNASSDNGRKYLQSAWNARFKDEQGTPLTAIPRWHWAKFMQESPTVLSGWEKEEAEQYTKEIQRQTKIMDTHTSTHENYTNAAEKRAIAINKLREVHAMTNALRERFGSKAKAPEPYIREAPGRPTPEGPPTPKPFTLSPGQVRYEGGVPVATVDKPPGGKGTPSTETDKQRLVAKLAMPYRKEFNALPEVKQFAAMSQSFTRMLGAYNESRTTKNFLAADQGLIVTFNKMLDPTSVVRESEYARTPENIALVRRLKGKWEKVTKGGAGLTQNDRAAIVKLSKEYMRVAQQKYNARLKEYQGYMKKQEIPLSYLKSAPQVELGTAPAATAPPTTGPIDPNEVVWDD